MSKTIKFKIGFEDDDGSVEVVGSVREIEDTPENRKRYDIAGSIGEAIVTTLDTVGKGIMPFKRTPEFAASLNVILQRTQRELTTLVFDNI